MGRVIDISARLSNEKTIVRLSEELEFEVDDSLENVMKFDTLVGDLSDIKSVIKGIEHVLGDEAAAKLDLKKYNLTNLKVIVAAIMAAIQDEEVDKVLAAFQDSAE